MKDTELSVGRPKAIPDQRFFNAIQKRLEENPHESIDDVSYTWLFQTVGGTRRRAKELLEKFKEGYIAKALQQQPEVPEDIQDEAHQLINKLVNKIYQLSTSDLQQELKDKESLFRKKYQQWEIEKKNFEDKIDQLEDETDKLDRDLAMTSETNITSESKIMDNKIEIEKLQDVIKKQGNTIDNQNSEIEKLSEINSLQEKQLDEKTRELSDKNQQIIEIQAKYDALSRQLQNCQSQAGITSRELEITKEQLEETKGRNIDLEVEKEQLQESLKVCELAKNTAEVKEQAAMERIKEIKESQKPKKIKEKDNEK